MPERSELQTTRGLLGIFLIGLAKIGHYMREPNGAAVRELVAKVQDEVIDLRRTVALLVGDDREEDSELWDLEDLAGETQSQRSIVARLRSEVRLYSLKHGIKKLFLNRTERILSNDDTSQDQDPETDHAPTESN